MGRRPASPDSERCNVVPVSVSASVLATAGESEDGVDMDEEEVGEGEDV